MSRRNLVHVISSLARGGAEQVLVTLCTHLAQHPYNYNQMVIFFYDGPLRTELANLNIPTIHVMAPFHYINPLFYLRLYRSFRNAQPHVVHSSLWFANFCAKILCSYLQIPLVSALHNDSFHSGYLRNVIDRYTPFRPTYYIAVAHDVAASYRSILRQEIICIANGIQEPKHHTTHMVKYTYIIGAVGRFIPSKNYSLLIQVFAHIHQEYPHTRLVIIGHGPQEQELKRLVKKLNLISVVTFIINQPAKRYYGLLDCFVHPSYSEGCPLSPLEARIHKIPTIITHDAQELTNKLRNYINYPIEAQDNAQSEYHKIQQKYSIETMITTYDHVLRQLN